MSDIDRIMKLLNHAVEEAETWYDNSTGKPLADPLIDEARVLIEQWDQEGHKRYDLDQHDASDEELYETDRFGRRWYKGSPSDTVADHKAKCPECKRLPDAGIFYHGQILNSIDYELVFNPDVLSLTIPQETARDLEGPWTRKS